MLREQGPKEWMAPRFLRGFENTERLGRARR